MLNFVHELLMQLSFFLFIECQYRKLSAPAHTVLHPGICDYNGGQGGN